MGQTHRGVLWLKYLRVLWSLRYGEDNVLFLHPKLKVKVVEISPCLTAWIGFMEELQVIHFFTQETWATSNVFQAGIFQVTPGISPTHSEEVLGDLQRDSEAGSFHLNSNHQDCVCSRIQWARDGSLAWRSKSMAWLSRGAELTLLPSQKAKTPWPCCLVESIDLCCLSNHAEANLRGEKLARAKPSFVSRITMVWAALTLINHINMVYQYSLNHINMVYQYREGPMQGVQLSLRTQHWECGGIFGIWCLSLFCPWVV